MANNSSIVTEVKGDLFELAPENAILVHACNARGSWGAGIAKAFRDQYPHAFQIYKTHCATQTNLLATALLIAPQPGDAKQHWIACLFTSIDYGRRKGSVASILAATKSALGDLKGQIEKLEVVVGERSKDEHNEGPYELWGCRFNSGKFGVPWERSRAIVEEIGLKMTVIELV